MTDGPDVLIHVVFSSALRDPCDERAIVLEAVGIVNQLRQLDGEYVLAVQIEDFTRAKQQLRLYAAENVQRSMPAIAQEQVSNGIIGATLYVVLLLVVFGLQYSATFSQSIITIGSAHAGAIQSGEWWRTITALTLHGDIAHLLGNICFGVLFGIFLSHTLGSGVAWLSILLAGIIGNVISGFIKAPHFSAIGASTAIFAALGILSAYTWQKRKSFSYSRLRRWTPLITGLALLAFLGGPGEKIDVFSHVSGFIAGVLCGGVLAFLSDRQKLSPQVQVFCGIGTISLVAISWIMAGLKGV